MPDNAQLIGSAYDAFGRGDIPGVLAVLDEDVTWDSPRPLPQATNGRAHDVVGSFFQKVGSSWEDLGLEIDDFVVSGDRVCVVGRAAGNLDGQRTGYGFVHAWTVRDGACVDFHEYVDPEPELLAG